MHQAFGPGLDTKLPNFFNIMSPDIYTPGMTTKDSLRVMFRDILDNAEYYVKEEDLRNRVSRHIEWIRDETEKKKKTNKRQLPWN